MASPLELLEGTSTVSTLNLDFQPPKLGERPSQLVLGQRMTWLLSWSFQKEPALRAP